ncbi:BglG family transcription antiterminator [Fundicoccus culcitae]|uniref:PRD domain-containing protein n=1 Tax=Fundicoccus culcitae TaxID=2969821 RepID=A0ABY5P1Y4_9LACT|nr:PRD domain-containing protein [Fundicoccus culcitae]UUX32722.1 PRD domain-containing protein [Fundicoccus culcitae]
MRIEHSSIRLLSILFETPETTTTELAKKMGVSTKTIQRYLTDILEIIEHLSIDLELIIHPNKGVKLSGDFNSFALVIQKLNQLSVNEEKDRLFFIINTIINSEVPITIQYLSETMHIARSTVEKSITDAREFLRDFNIEIKGTNKGLTIKANEKQKRKILSELISQYWHGIVVNVDEDETLPLNISLNNQLMPMIDQELIEAVQVLVNQFVIQHSLNITEYQYQSFIIHIAIAIDRINKDFYIQNLETHQELNDLTTELVADIEETFDIDIPLLEQHYLNLHIQGMVNQVRSDDDKTLIEKLDYGLEIITILEQQLSYLNPDQMLLTDLSVHLNTSVKRLKQNITVRNPYKDEIRSKYSAAFNIAVELAVELSSHFEILFNIDEMTYIAIYLQAFFERQKTEKLDVVLVCASGYGTVKLLEQRLKNHFSNSINITDTIGLDKLNTLDFANKLIISTIPINTHQDNVISVSPLLTEQDIQNISHRISRQNIFQSNSFLELVNSDLIFLSKGMNENWKTVIEIIVSQLIMKGYAEVGLLESVYSRERLSSTAMEFFSMPHGDVKYIKQSTISVYVNPNGIQWGKQRINVVFFFAIQPDDQIQINDVYKDFNHLISNEKWVNQLINTENREHLINLFKNERNESNE